jgi:general secretion pathway protein G
MFESARRARSGEAGFTLVELLVVIVILGILAAIVVFAVGGISDKGDSAAKKADCSTLQAAEEAYFAEQGSYTANQQDLVDQGFLHDKSTLHPSITLTTTAGGKASYTIGGCS